MKAVKFLFLALVACTVCLTSCKKPDPEPEPTPGPTPSPTGTAKVTFGEQSWNIGWSDCGVVDNNGTQLLFVNAAPENPSNSGGFPMLYFHMKAETGRHMPSTDESLFMFYYYAKVFNLNLNGQTLSNLADYWAGNTYLPMGTANIEISALDVSTLTVTIKGQAQFWDAIAYIQAYNAGTENIVAVDFTIDANNFKLTPRATKGMGPVAVAPASENLVF